MFRGSNPVEAIDDADRIEGAAKIVHEQPRGRYDVARRPP
jgi:hypothetical protein